MPLAFTQEDFLVLIFVCSKTQKITPIDHREVSIFMTDKHVMKIELSFSIVKVCLWIADSISLCVGGGVKFLFTTHLLIFHLFMYST